MGMLYLQATIVPRVDDERLSHEYHHFHHRVKYDRGRWPRQRRHRRARGHSCCVVVPEEISIETDRCATSQETSRSKSWDKVSSHLSMSSSSAEGGETVHWVKI